MKKKLFTKIEYKLKTRSHVKLIVSDILDRRIATLVDEVEGPGEKLIKFNSSGLASGKYYYQLSVSARGSNGRSGGSIETKKMILIM